MFELALNPSARCLRCPRIAHSIQSAGCLRHPVQLRHAFDDNMMVFGPQGAANRLSNDPLSRLKPPSKLLMSKNSMLANLTTMLRCICCYTDAGMQRPALQRAAGTAYQPLSHEVHREPMQTGSVKPCSIKESKKQMRMGHAQPKGCAAIWAMAQMTALLISLLLLLLPSTVLGLERLDITLAAMTFMEAPCNPMKSCHAAPQRPMKPVGIGCALQRLCCLMGTAPIDCLLDLTAAAAAATATAALKIECDWPEQARDHLCSHDKHGDPAQSNPVIPCFSKHLWHMPSKGCNAV